MTKPVVYADPEINAVQEFHLKFGQLAPENITHLTRRKMLERVKFHFEEASEEFAKAAAAQDMALMADALVDAVYVLKGSAVMLGLTSVWSKLWNDVHEANMRKVPGATHRGNLVDVKKPPGWVGPQTLAILAEAGYRVEEFFPDGDVSNESRCLDDLIHLDRDNA